METVLRQLIAFRATTCSVWWLASETVADAKTPVRTQLEIIVAVEASLVDIAIDDSITQEQKASVAGLVGCFDLRFER